MSAVAAAAGCSHLIKLLGLQLLHCCVNDGIVTQPQVIPEPEDYAPRACWAAHSSCTACCRSDTVLPAAGAYHHTSTNSSCLLGSLDSEGAGCHGWDNRRRQWKQLMLDAGATRCMRENKQISQRTSTPSHMASPAVSAAVVSGHMHTLWAAAGKQLAPAADKRPLLAKASLCEC